MTPTSWASPTSRESSIIRIWGIEPCGKLWVVAKIGRPCGACPIKARPTKETLVQRHECNRPYNFSTSPHNMKHSYAIHSEVTDDCEGSWSIQQSPAILHATLADVLVIGRARACRYSDAFAANSEQRPRPPFPQSGVSCCPNGTGGKVMRMVEGIQPHALLLTPYGLEAASVPLAHLLWGACCLIMIDGHHCKQELVQRPCVKTSLFERGNHA